jgi:hypothetical protein
VSRVVYVLSEGRPVLYGGLLLGLIISAILYVNFWRAKEWARITLGALIALRGILGLGAAILVSMSDGDPLPYFELSLHFLGILLGGLLLFIPGVGRYLKSIN